MLPRPNPKGSGYKNKARLRGLNCILDLHPQQRNKGTMPEPPPPARAELHSRSTPATTNQKRNQTIVKYDVYTNSN